PVTQARSSGRRVKVAGGAKKPLSRSKGGVEESFPAEAGAGETESSLAILAREDSSGKSGTAGTDTAVDVAAMSAIAGTEGAGTEGPVGATELGWWRSLVGCPGTPEACSAGSAAGAPAASAGVSGRCLSTLLGVIWVRWALADDSVS